MNWHYDKVSVTRVGPTEERFAREAKRGVLTLDSILEFAAQPVRSGLDEVILDLSKVGWVGLFEWSCLMVLLHSRLESDTHLKISIDFVGDRPSGLIPYSECRAFVDDKLPVPKHTRADYVDSYVVHHLLNFVRAVEGPTGFENVAGGRLVLRWLSGEEARRPGWFRRNPDVEDSVIFPRTYVSAAEMSIRFVTRSQVEVWRQSMRKKNVPDAAVFASDEFWRILCHELARNVSEHAEGPGFLTARVVLPSKGALPRWCNDVLSGTALERSQAANDSGFLELCVCDAGLGIPKTVSTAFANRYRERWLGAEPPSPVHDLDLLKFAFDELSTRKDLEHSWLTDRHALGHILFLVGKYGGALRLCSGRNEVSYAPKDSVCRRCKTQLGYEPETAQDYPHALPGTHIQIIIPLTAKPPAQGTPRQRALTQHLPESYHVDPKHPVGPLVPVREKLDVLASCVSGDEVKMFQESCRALAKSLLPVPGGEGGHPRHEIMVFDFAEVDWPPAMFETFLYLFQNVLVGRPVIFTNVEQSFAKLICGFEENAEAPSFLPKEMRNEIHERARDREFTDGRFLETYSGIGAVVLGLGPETGEYLFGLRNRRLRTALLEIVAGEEQTAKGLAEAHGLEPGTVEVVLSAARTLFRCRQDGRWELAWPRHERANDGRMVDTIEVQRLRSIIGHFDLVAKNCDAWRQSATPPASSKPLPARFYLPSEDTVYSAFFESSRILARDRYVTEVAERLIHRILYGLTHLCQPARNLSEIRVIACSTTPSVMLAQAVRRAWPVGTDSERPVVIDYGPALFSGADPARMPSSNHPHGAVVIHDVFDEGRLSSRLIAMAQAQEIEVLLEACFVRFLKLDERSEGDSVAYAATAGWKMLNAANRLCIPVHAMVGIASPDKKRRGDVADWGSSDEHVDHVVDPRSLRPVPLRSLRLESGVSEERSLTKRDPYLKELDANDGQCRLAAGHFVYGQRHFGVVADVRGILTGAIGRRIIVWLADVCCDEKNRQKPVWEIREGDRPMPEGEVTAILMPLHSQIHYLLPGLQIELAQRGKRVPHFFLDATSFGGGVETYDAPYQLLNQIEEAAQEIKALMDASPGLDCKAPKVVKKQLRLLIVDDAIFSGRTIQTLVDSIGKRHLPYIRQRVYRGDSRYADPIEWIRGVAVLNELPAAKSAMWYQLTRCSVCEVFRFDAYAPFVGVATYTAHDCPACRELEYLEHGERRAEAAGATAALAWLKKRREALLPLSTEAPSFGTRICPTLPEAIDVLALPGDSARERYKAVHADSAIWRFFELMFLSYPLSDVLGCLKTTRETGARYPEFRGEYARFRLAVYDWCIRNWHQFRLYHTHRFVLRQLMEEVKGSEPYATEAVYGFCRTTDDRSVHAFIHWLIRYWARQERDRASMSWEGRHAIELAVTNFLLAERHGTNRFCSMVRQLSEARRLIPDSANLLNVLYMRVTRPREYADPRWALSTIADTVFRGSARFHGHWRECKHELLGKLVDKAIRLPQSTEVRYRLQESLSCFVAATETLNTYLSGDILARVRDAAAKVLASLMAGPDPDGIHLDLLRALDRALGAAKSWVDFEKQFHLTAEALGQRLSERWTDLRGKKSRLVPVFGDEHTRQVCLLAHIPSLVHCISNVGFDPAPQADACPPSLTIKMCEKDPRCLSVLLATSYLPPQASMDEIASSANVGRELHTLRLFGVEVLIIPPVETTRLDTTLTIEFRVPVGYKPKER